MDSKRPVAPSIRFSKGFSLCNARDVKDFGLNPFSPELVVAYDDGRAVGSPAALQAFGYTPDSPR
jgi:hypothetical protein